MAGRKANYQWETLPAVANTVFATSASNTVTFQDLGSFENPVTVRRLIVDVYLSSQSITDNVQISGRVGLIIVAPQVASVGATAVPRPITDGERPWLWNRAYGFRQDSNATGLNYIPLHLHDDVRGMRKAKQNDHIICVIENAIGGTIASMASIRMLLST